VSSGQKGWKGGNDLSGQVSFLKKKERGEAGGTNHALC